MWRAAKVASQQLSQKHRLSAVTSLSRTGHSWTNTCGPPSPSLTWKRKLSRGRGFRSSARVGKGEQQQGRACSRIKNNQASARTLEEHNRRHSLTNFLFIFCFEIYVRRFVSSSRKWKHSTLNLKCGRSRFHTPFCSSRVFNPPSLPVSVYAINNSCLINKLLVQAERRPGNSPGSSWFMNATQSNVACKPCRLHNTTRSDNTRTCFKRFQ